MKKAISPVLVLFVFVAESIVVDNLPPVLFGLPIIPVPHFLLVTILLMVVFYDAVYGIYYGLFTGLLYDLIYTDIIGVDMFIYTLLAYLMVQVMKRLHANGFMMLLLTAAAVGSLELLVYGLYSLIGIAKMGIEPFLNNRLYPTLLFNGLFLLIVFFPFRKLFSDLTKPQRSEK